MVESLIVGYLYPSGYPLEKTETLQIKIPCFIQLYRHLLGFGKVFRFRKVGAAACSFFVALASASQEVL